MSVISSVKCWVSEWLEIAHRNCRFQYYLWDLILSLPADDSHDIHILVLSLINPLLPTVLATILEFMIQRLLNIEERRREIPFELILTLCHSARPAFLSYKSIPNTSLWFVNHDRRFNRAQTTRVCGELLHCYFKGPGLQKLRFIFPHE